MAQFDGYTYRSILTDALGSVLPILDPIAGSAQLLGNQLYGPYGNKRYQAGWIGTSKGFTGQRDDAATGLDYFNARYYDPVVGRFVSADTVEGNPQGLDPYAYVKGNPETVADPTGHSPVMSCRITCSPILPPPSSRTHSPSLSCGATCNPIVPGWAPPATVVQPTRSPSLSCRMVCPPVGYSQTSSSSSKSSKHHTTSESTQAQRAGEPDTTQGFVTVILDIVDGFLGISAMRHDVETIINPDAGLWDKTWAVTHLAALLAMDMMMFVSFGAIVKEAYMVWKLQGGMRALGVW